MKVYRIDNNQHTPSFGTYLGVNLQEKIILAQSRNAFSKEQYANLHKIEDDGKNLFLELADRYVISSVNNRKGIMKIKKVLNLTDGINKVEIADVSHAYEDSNTRNKFIFRIERFLKIFNDDFNLSQKIEQASEKFAQDKR